LETLDANIVPENLNKDEILTVMNTNARSLCPKVSSLIDNLANLNCHLGVVTETWLADGETLQADLQDLQDGTGYSMLTLNRPANARGVSHGGVAVVTRDSRVSAKKFKFHNPHGYELLAVTSKITGQYRRLFTLACYLPPNMKADASKDCMQLIVDVIHEAKRKLDQPLILVAGDFNQFKVERYLAEHVDLGEISAGPTRGSKTIDRMFTNFKEHESGVVAALQSDGDGSDSDHRVMYASTLLPLRNKRTWETFTMRKFSNRGAEYFQKWITGQDWAEVYQSQSVNGKVEAYQKIIAKGMDEFFPLKKVRRASDEPPWYNARLRKEKARNRRLFKNKGRTETWKKLEHDTAKYEEECRLAYKAVQMDKLTGKHSTRDFYKIVRNYKTAEKPKQFDCLSLFPGLTEGEATEELAAYFTDISDEFMPLDPSDIPLTHDRELPQMEPYQIAGKLRSFRKPTSRVEIDLFPQLVTLNADILALPITDIFNAITEDKVWPVAWKREYVTAIPKKGVPGSLEDLRNISCTALMSKVYESLVLEWLGQEIKLKSNQFGGTKGCSVDHLLCNIWHEIGSNLEDSRAATLLTAIDYSKAFNRLNYKECLEALARLGASSQVLQLVGTFLTNRTMSVKIGESWSNPRPINGGVPQGSLLGVLLFNATTDDLESGPNVHDRDVFETPCGLPCSGVVMAAQEEREEIPEPVPDRVLTSTPSTGAGTRTSISEDFGTPSRTDIRIRNNLRRVGESFRFLPEARNVRRLLNPVEGEVPVPPEPPTGNTNWRWQEKHARVLKYVDDGTILSKVNMANCDMILGEEEERGRPVRIKRDYITENIFKRTTERAMARGMKVNVQKTAMIAISDANTYTPRMYIQDLNGEEIASMNTEVRILGFMFDTTPTVRAQVNNIISKTRRKLWILRHLRSFGLTEAELVSVYKSMIRSVIEFTSVVYHSMLTGEQSSEIERLQQQALKCIFGIQFSYRALLEKTGLETLECRRVMAVDAFAKKSLEGRFAHWFPLRESGRSLRKGNKYVEEYARTDRLKNTPVYYMRRRLNELSL